MYMWSVQDAHVHARANWCKAWCAGSGHAEVKLACEEEKETLVGGSQHASWLGWLSRERLDVQAWGLMTSWIAAGRRPRLA